MAPHERGYRFIFVMKERLGRREVLAEHAAFGVSRKQRRNSDGPNRSRHHHLHAVGNRNEFTAIEDVSLTFSVVRRNESIADAGVMSELSGPRLGSEERIRAGFDQEIIATLCADYATQPR